jgi:protoporphyrinogen oxidase
MTINFKNRPRRVAVIGGGACGMAAAWELAQHGAEVTVLEREPWLGGLCATHEQQGWRFDLGGHRFISRSGELVERIRRLLGEDLLRRDRRSVILQGGKQYLYPLAERDLARHLSLWQGLRAVSSYAKTRLVQRVRPSPDRTFEEWVTARFGPYLYDLFFGPYTEKLWGIPPSQLSADWASERISLLSLSDAMLRLCHLSRTPRPRSYARGYFYPRLGIGHIFDAIGRDIDRLGARTLLGTQVVGLERDRRGAVGAVRYVGADGHEGTLPCDYVISTASLPLVTRWLFPSDDGLRRHGEALRYRAVRFLNVMLDRAEVSPNTWMYVSEPRYLATRVQEPKHRSPAMAPPGKTSLMLELPCGVGDAIWSASDAELYERCISDLDSLGIHGLRQDTLGLFSTFVAEGYPIYSLGYAEHQKALLASIATAPNLLSCGRQGTFRYVFMDIAMEMGIAAARQVLGGQVRQASFASFRTDRQLIEAQSLTA